MQYAKLEGVKGKTYLLRHIVPFKYGENDSSAYEKVVDILKENSDIWKKIENTEAETDCYDYIRAQMELIDKDKTKNTGVGSIWRCNAFDKENAFFVIRYQKEYARIKEAGLHLLKNNIGLFWYSFEFVDISTKNKKCIEEIPVETLIDFQFELKELARTGSKKYDCMWAHEYSRMSEKNAEENQDNTFTFIRKDNNEELLNKCNLLLCPNERERIDYLERPSGGGFVNEVLLEVQKYPIGYTIHKILDTINPTFFANREIEKSDGTRILIPDKSILYNYVLVQCDAPIESKEILETLAFYLTHGYKASYKPSDEATSEMMYPFENVLWSIEKEGCGIYASSSKSNDEFLSVNMVNRVERDYFLLYMNLLQQSYVALQLAEEIAKTIPSNKDEILDCNEALTKVFADLETRINLFVVKNVYASVSHVGHHNDFYKYGERVLRIKEDIEALRDGLGALDDIHRRHEADEEGKSADMMKNAFAVLTIISIFSLPRELKDAFTFWAQNILIAEGFIFPIWGEYAIRIATLAIGVWVIRMAWPSMRRSFKRDKKK